MTNILLTGRLVTDLLFSVGPSAVVLWLMTQQLASDIDMAEESELRRLEGAPPSFPSVRVLSGGSRPIRVGNGGGDQGTCGGVARCQGG